MKRSKPINSSRPSKKSRPERQTAAQLDALQRLMARAVMRPLSPSMRMRRQWSDGRPTQKIAAAFVKPNDRLTSFQRLEIYNRQYWLRLVECFYDDYPGLHAVLGERKFATLAIAYIANNPSTSFTLRNLGQYLVSFIRAQPRWTAPSPQLALDMARLEWAHIEAFDNGSQPPVTGADLLGRNPVHIRLRLQPYITLLDLGWPLDDYLIALRDNGRLRGEASNAIEVASAKRNTRMPRLPKPRATWLAVHRHQNTVYYKRLTKHQFSLLTLLQSGASLEKALQSCPPAAAPQISRWFQDWSALGWFYSVTRSKIRS